MPFPRLVHGWFACEADFPPDKAELRKASYGTNLRTARCRSRLAACDFGSQGIMIDVFTYRIQKRLAIGALGAESY